MAKFASLGAKIGGDVAEISTLVQTTFMSQSYLMKIVPLTQKPGDKVLGQLFEATSLAMAAVQVRELSFRSSRTPPLPSLASVRC